MTDNYVNNKNAAASARFNMPLIAEATVHFIVAMIVLFSAVLHENIVFNKYVFVFSLIAFGLVRILFALLNTSQSLANKKSQELKNSLLPAVCLSLLDACAALAAAVFVQQAADLWLAVAIWAAAVVVVRVIFLVALNSSASFGRSAAIFAIILLVAVLFCGADQVAVIGWFGAYAVLFGVFGLIAGFDRGGAADTSNSLKTGNIGGVGVAMTTPAESKAE